MFYRYCPTNIDKGLVDEAYKNFIDSSYFTIEKHLPGETFDFERAIKNPVVLRPTFDMKEIETNFDRLRFNPQLIFNLYVASKVDFAKFMKQREEIANYFKNKHTVSEKRLTHFDCTIGESLKLEHNYNVAKDLIQVYIAKGGDIETIQLAIANQRRAYSKMDNCIEKDEMMEELARLDIGLMDVHTPYDNLFNHGTQLYNLKSCDESQTDRADKLAWYEASIKDGIQLFDAKMVEVIADSRAERLRVTAESDPIYQHLLIGKYNGALLVKQMAKEADNEEQG